jgi:hypothetical protein
MLKTLTYRGPALAVLHEEYAKKHRIDPEAPTHGRREVVISAPAAQVWRTLTDVQSWGTTLEPGVHDIDLEQGVQVDAPFSRSNKGARMKARFAVVDADRELAWTGSAFGAKVVHRFVVEPLTEASTKVVVEESMAGPLLAVAFSSDKLVALLETSLAALKSAAEATPR